MQPTLTEIMQLLSDREPIFHRPEYAATLEEFDRMMVHDYWEIGASGKRYDRAFILEVLAERLAHPAPDPWQTKDFACRQLGENTYLLTYTLTQDERVTRRATVWRQTDGEWQILYHQGTIAS
jgi:hypothetical protein